MISLFNMQINFKILGTPTAKQSARFRSFNVGDRNFIQSYQSKKVKDAERNIAFDIKSQLPEGFQIMDCPIGAEVTFVFYPPKSFSKAKIKQLQDGEIIYKDTKPDLVDNLMKGLFDAMAGIVFTNDSRIAATKTKKIYGFEPATIIKMYEV
jgi:Holliday junction resolvase RusA-like endonuclease